MSITCTDISDSELTSKSAYLFTKDFVHAHGTLPAECTLFDPNHQFPKVFLPAKYRSIASTILNLEVRKDDIWIITFPKSGTTLMSSIVWLLKNKLDFNADTKTRLNFRVHYLESSMIFNSDYSAKAALLTNVLNSQIDIMNAEKSPRIIKTHLHVNLLPKQIWTVKPKIIYVTRNPKDVAVSFYHHYRNIQGYEGNFDNFMDAFLANQVIYTPIHDHVKNYSKLRGEKNFLSTTFERIRETCFDEVKKISEFLNETFSDDQLRKLCEHVSFEKMKLNPGTNWEIDINALEQFFDFQRPEEDFR